MARGKNSYIQDGKMDQRYLVARYLVKRSFYFLEGRSRASGSCRSGDEDEQRVLEEGLGYNFTCKATTRKR